MKDLAFVLYPHRGSAKAITRALNLYVPGRARAACVFALSIVIWLVLRVGIAAETLDQTFDGSVALRVQPLVGDAIAGQELADPQ